MPLPACLAANHLLEWGVTEGRAFTPLQVLNLVYLAHAYHLADGRGPLLDEAVEATPYGPYIPSLYRQVKPYGSGAVTTLLRTGPYWWTRDSHIQQHAAEFLGQIWRAYASVSGKMLAEITHAPGSPWWVTWNEQGGKNRWHPRISDDLIEAHYREKLARTGRATAAGAAATSAA